MGVLLLTVFRNPFQLNLHTYTIFPKSNLPGMYMVVVPSCCNNKNVSDWIIYEEHKFIFYSSGGCEVQNQSVGHYSV
jgi:hypothetical protein